MSITYGHSLTMEEYRYLRNSAGWGTLPEKQAQAGIDHSVFLITAKDNERTVGMARVNTDGGCVAFILDVVVLPEYQKQGIGRALMIEVMSFIRNSLAPGDIMYVCLMAAKGKEGFYQKFGFDERPNDYLGAGMTQWIKSN